MRDLKGVSAAPRFWLQVARAERESVQAMAVLHEPFGKCRVSGVRLRSTALLSMAQASCCERRDT